MVKRYLFITPPGLALNDDSMLIDAEKITLQKDDGSLGGTPDP